MFVDRNQHTEAGANRLAGIIRDYWRSRGKSPEVWIAPATEYGISKDAKAGVWCVLSEMVNGLPRS